jgi:hypothetical protein
MTAFLSLSKSPGLPDMFNSSRQAHGQCPTRHGVLVKNPHSEPENLIKVNHANDFNRVPEPALLHKSSGSTMKNLAIDFGVGTAATVAGNKLLKPSNTESGTYLADSTDPTNLGANQNQLTTSSMPSNGTNSNQAYTTN